MMPPILVRAMSCIPRDRVLGHAIGHDEKRVWRNVDHHAVRDIQRGLLDGMFEDHEVEWVLKQMLGSRR